MRDPTSEPLLLACDWGTTNLRAWTLDAEGRVLQARAFPLGVAQLAPGEARRRFVEEVRPALAAEGAPAILCGMIGSNLGWTAIPYAPCPAGLEDLAARLVAVEDGGPGARIAPGVRGDGFSGQGDVMRGEETQVMGWLARHPDRRMGRHLVCCPGTHAKWTLVQDGRITGFVTAMTGELFAVLSQHSVLRADAAIDDPEAFAAGLAAAGDGGALAARLFTARARVVAGGADPAGGASYLSGLLIGADAAASPGLLGCAADMPVSLIGEPRLCGLYRQALAARGTAAEIFDGADAAVAGLFALARMETAT
jgi:2-dehydro-3-deoxygalactonokinase